MNRRNSPGCRCCGAVATLSVTVRGCHVVPLAGAIVTATQGGQPPVTATTNGSGVATLSLTATGVWTLTTNDPLTTHRFAQDVRTTTIVGGSNAVAFTMTPATGYACIGTFGGPSGCGYPVKTTLYMTDGYGTTALVYEPAAPHPVEITGYWYATVQRPVIGGSLAIKSCAGAPSWAPAGTLISCTYAFNGSTVRIFMTMNFDQVAFTTSFVPVPLATMTAAFLGNPYTCAAANSLDNTLGGAQANAVLACFAPTIAYNWSCTQVTEPFYAGGPNPYNPMVIGE